MKFNKKEVSWALYDWANSSFATTVMAGFFPIFFKTYFAAGEEPGKSTFILGTSNSIGFLLMALMAPVIGAIADKRSSRKKFLFFFSLTAITFVFGLAFLGKGEWRLASLFYIISIFGFSGANVFYDSLLVHSTTEKNLHYTSALGFSLGYLGGGLLFALNVLMVLNPGWFFLDGPEQAIKVSFAIVSIWWLVFSIPIWLFVAEPGEKTSVPFSKTIIDGIGQFVGTLKKIRSLKVIFLFLLAYWLYIDAVDTIIVMAVDFGLSIGLDSNDLIKALLITQFVGFPATLVYGKIGDKLGPKIGIYLTLSVYIMVCIGAYFMKSTLHFYFLAATIGLVQGGVQSLSRSLYAQLIPKDMASEFFGFYNMLGKFAAVLGPFLMGTIALLTKNPRFSMLGLIILFVLGGVLLSFVDVKEGKKYKEQF